MTEHSQRSDVQSVREAAWPDSLPADSSRSDRKRSDRQKVLRNVLVAGLVSILFFLSGKHVIAGIAAVLAAVLATLGLVAPAAFRAVDSFGRRLGGWAGNGIGYFLLAFIFLICFVPGRLALLLRRKDPMRRAFPSPEASCWHEHKGSDSADSYSRQF